MPTAKEIYAKLMETHDAQAARVFLAPLRHFQRMDREYQEQCDSPTCSKCGQEKLVGQQYCGDCWAFEASAP